MHTDLTCVVKDSRLSIIIGVGLWVIIKAKIGAYILNTLMQWLNQYTIQSDCLVTRCFTTAHRTSQGVNTGMENTFLPHTQINMHECTHFN